MLAAAVTLSLFAFVLVLVVDVIRRDGRKIWDALQGRSVTAEPAATRQISVRFSLQRKATEPHRLQPALRAAA